VGDEVACNSSVGAEAEFGSIIEERGVEFRHRAGRIHDAEVECQWDHLKNVTIRVVVAQRMRTKSSISG
jgi:hypothetical protein